MQKIVKSRQRDVVDFPEHYRSTVLDVRAALTELLMSVRADPTKPQEIARRFKLNKNLTWMVSKVVNATDVYAVAPHIPGPGRVESMLTSMARNGAPDAAIERLRVALRSFDEMVEVHTGDRATLELMISELSPLDVKGEQLFQSRKLAFRGMSGILGGQARTRVTLYIMAPNADDPTSVDLAEVNGLLGFRRLRSDSRWLLFRRQRWSGEGPEPADRGDEPLDPNISSSDEMPLLPEFCSQPIRHLDTVRFGEEIQHELPPGPVGDTAAQSFVYGVVTRKAGSVFADEFDPYCELGSSQNTPTETLLFDLLVHEDLAWAMRPELGVYSRLNGDPAQMALRLERNRVPVTEAIESLGRGIDRMVTPLTVWYTDMLRSVLKRLDWDPSRFNGFRLTLPYPPIPSSIVFRMRLRERE